MSNIYSEFQERVGSMIVVIFPLAVIGIILSAWVISQDLMSTVYAIDMLPTRKVSTGFVSAPGAATGMIVAGMEGGNGFRGGSITAWAIGGLVLVTQIVLFYMYTVDTSKTWARALATLVFIFDSGTDIFFKMSGQWDFFIFIVALIETLFIYTFVSEFLFTVFCGFVIQTAGNFFVVAGESLNNMIDAVMNFAGQETARYGTPIHAKTNSGQRQKYQNQGGARSKGRGKKVPPGMEDLLNS